MLTVPLSDEPLRVMGIDPSTSQMGVSCLSSLLYSKPVVVEYATTFKPTHNDPAYSSYIDIHGARQARLVQMSIWLQDILIRFNPHVVVCESSYMGKHAEAFGALMEAISMIRNTLYAVDIHKPFFTVDPTTVKKAVGVKISRTMSKEDVATALRNRTDLVWNIPLASLDEHSIDATAIGLFHYLCIR